MVARRAARMAASLFASVCLAADAACADGMADDAHAPPFTWTGLYIGYHSGGALALSDTSDPLGPTLFGNPVRSPGPFAGGQLGYNYQHAGVVLGLEADLAFAEMEGAATCSAVSGDFVPSNCRVSIDAFGTLTGRLGVVLGPEGRALLYGKGGAAWSTGSVLVATNDYMEGGLGNPFAIAESDITLWGWTLGGGIEYALTGNWSVKGEYAYTDFGSQSVALLSSAYLSSTGAITGLAPGREGRILEDMHTLKVGMNYRLGDYASLGDIWGSLVDGLGDHGADAVRLEIGGRYWYGWGQHKFDLGVGRAAPLAPEHLVSRLTYDDLETQTGEVVARVDAPWSLFAKGFAGAGTTRGAHMNDEDFVIPMDQAGTIWVPYTNALLPRVTGAVPSYATIDIGYDWVRADGYRVGSYIGYNYFHETMDAYGCVQLANPLGPCGPAEGSTPTTGAPVITQEAEWRSLRLGSAIEVSLAPGLKVSVDAAYLPWVRVTAVDHHYFGNSGELASINEQHGHGVGTQLEAMLSYDVTERLSIGVGGRYWAMWTTDATFRRTYEWPAPIEGDPQYIRLQSERAGVLGQLTYRFGPLPE